jgi:hypothetical protein
MVLDLSKYLNTLNIKVNKFTPVLVINKRIKRDINLDCSVFTYTIQQALDETIDANIDSQFSLCYLNLTNTNTPINKARYKTNLDSIDEYLLNVAYQSLLNNGYLIIESKHNVDLTKFKLIQVNNGIYCKTTRRTTTIILPTYAKPIESLAKSTKDLVSKSKRIKSKDKLTQFPPSKHLNRLKLSYPISLERKNLYWILREGDIFIENSTGYKYKVTRVTYKSDYDPPLVEAIGICP